MKCAFSLARREQNNTSTAADANSMNSPLGHLSFFLLLLLLLLLLQFSTSTSAVEEFPSVPLSTQSRWIVDNDGRRVKLACASWSAHLEPALVEGLNKDPVEDISKRIASMGFNCVRITWATYFLTYPDLSVLNVRNNLINLNLTDAVSAIAATNPDLIDLGLFLAFDGVISALAKDNIMVILDNHVSKPGWCCSGDDGNGFFGDEYFDPDEWLRGLEKMATLVNTTSNVVGMSLRNELRGPKANVDDWYRYMQQAAEVVHAANPRLLVILSGLDYGTELSFLSERPVNVTFKDKLVFEIHWYASTRGRNWMNGNLDKNCEDFVASFMKSGGFLLEKGWPLVLSEFGSDQTGTDVESNRFMTCILSLVAKLDLDWFIWTLQGSYYVRFGIQDDDERYGVLNVDWTGARNPNFTARVATLQSPLQGPLLGINEPYSVLFHPLTGQCVVVKPKTSQLVLGSCAQSEEWIYTEEHTLKIRSGSSQCLRAEGVGQAATVGAKCNILWELLSDIRIASTFDNGDTLLCLEPSSDGSILTNVCRCIDGEDGNCSPESQWFKIVNINES